MKNEISFMTGIFESGVPKQAAASDHLLGEDLARWLIGKSHGGEFVFDQPVQDACGWSEAVRAEGEEFKLAFEIMHDTVGLDYSEWRIKIDTVKKWGLFGSNNSQVRGRLCDHIHNVLRDEYHFREIQWCD